MNTIKMGKILIVGVCDIPHSTNVFMKKGFEKLGYEVYTYNYRTVYKELGQIGMWNDYVQFIINKKYDLILFSKVSDFNPGLVNLSRHYGKTWYWFMDDIDMADRINSYELVERCDFASSTSSDVMREFKKFNNNSYQIIEGYDPEVFYKEDLPKIYDVTFFGSATKERVRAVERLKDFNVTIFGEHWPEGFGAYPSVYRDDLRKVINQSKIILNFCHGNIFSDRVVTSMACGAFVLSEYCEDIGWEFDPEDELVSFCDIADAIVKTEEYLNIDHRRNDIAFNGSRKAKEFTWKNQCEEIISKAGL